MQEFGVEAFAQFTQVTTERLTKSRHQNRLSSGSCRTSVALWRMAAAG
jgi:hypothetical protein